MSYPGHQGHPQYPQPTGQPQPTTTQIIDTTGAFDGCQYRIDHRDSNSLLAIHLQQGYEIKAKPGSMVAMDASVKIKGKVIAVSLDILRYGSS